MILERGDTVLVTGAAGFIGFHLSDRLLAEGFAVIGFDSLNTYYDVRLKEARLAQLTGRPGFRFVKGDLVDANAVRHLFADARPAVVVHLAAQPGVRYGLINPGAYVDCNLVGFLSILEGCRHTPVKHLVYASSSSVYGLNAAVPFSEHHGVDHPVSLYAATKKANELMAHTYSHLFAVPTTGLRFFTVYGPWGRPDMAPILFAKAILEGRPIQVFNHGQMRRDFTYIDDIIEGVRRVMDAAPAPDPAATGAHADPARSASAPYRVYNIGNHSPVELLEFIQLLEQELGRTAEKVMLPMQPGDVIETYADVSDLTAAVGFSPATPIADGIRRLGAWINDNLDLVRSLRT
ncbi:MAG: NAD-dependent epimerase [Rhodospirillales bacterium]|nr:NAD-dependent epimerase [Rhodospirillales bacterium]